jgi:hypothetical protein
VLTDAFGNAYPPTSGLIGTVLRVEVAQAKIDKLWSAGVIGAVGTIACAGGGALAATGGIPGLVVGAILFPSAAQRIAGETLLLFEAYDPALPALGGDDEVLVIDPTRWTVLEPEDDALPSSALPRVARGPRRIRPCTRGPLARPCPRRLP